MYFGKSIIISLIPIIFTQRNGMFPLLSQLDKARFTVYVKITFNCRCMGFKYAATIQRVSISPESDDFTDVTI